jgi:hypothetical protein
MDTVPDTPVVLLTPEQAAEALGGPVDLRGTF